MISTLPMLVTALMGAPPGPHSAPGPTSAAKAPAAKAPAAPPGWTLRMHDGWPEYEPRKLLSLPTYVRFEVETDGCAGFAGSSEDLYDRKMTLRAAWLPKELEFDGWESSTVICRLLPGGRGLEATFSFAVEDMRLASGLIDAVSDYVDAHGALPAPPFTSAPAPLGLPPGIAPGESGYLVTPGDTVIGVSLQAGDCEDWRTSTVVTAPLPRPVTHFTTGDWDWYSNNDGGWACRTSVLGALHLVARWGPQGPEWSAVTPVADAISQHLDAHGAMPVGTTKGP